MDSQELISSNVKFSRVFSNKVLEKKKFNKNGKDRFLVRKKEIEG